MKRCLFFVVVSVWTASCTLGPNYRRPTVAMPSAYRDTTAAIAQPGPASLADVPWFDLFKDDTLGQLLRTALAQNFDVAMVVGEYLEFDMARILDQLLHVQVAAGERGGSLCLRLRH